jgi:hypothetical protein
LLTAFASALGNVDAELNLQLSLLNETAPMQSLNLELRLVAGIGYVNFDALRQSVDEETMSMGGTELAGWGGLNLVELFATLTDQGMLGQGQMQSPPPDMDAYLALVENYVIVERLTDDDGAAVFQTTVDIARLYAEPAFWETMGMGEMGADNQMQQMGQLFEGASLVSTATIGLDDYYIRAITMNLTWNMPSMANTQAGTSATAMPEGTAESTEAESSATAGGSMGTLQLAFTMNFDDFNGAPEIAAPENATIVETEDMLNLLFGGAMTNGEMSGTTIPMATPTATP